MRSFWKKMTGDAKPSGLVFPDDIGISGGVVGVGNFLPIYIDDDTATSLVSWDTIPRSPKVQDLDALVSISSNDDDGQIYLNIG